MPTGNYVLPDGGRLEVKRCTSGSISQDSHIEIIDAESVSFPLSIRPWIQGDRFTPLGMSGTKKVSDFMVDQKLNYFDKKDLLILTSDDKIVWIMGHRLDENFKITSQTKDFIQLSFSPAITI